MTLVDQIREMISAGETEKSLEELYKFVKENNADIIDNLVMLRSRMQSVERAVNVGTMSSHEAALEKAKINDAILKLLPQLTPEYLAEASKRKAAAPSVFTPHRPTVPAQNNSKLYMIIGGLGGALLLLISLFVWANGCGAEEETMLGARLAANGTATWEATVNHIDETGPSSFVFQDNVTCAENAYGELIGAWKVVEDAADHVTIYASDIGEYIRISETTAQVRSEEDSEWKLFYDGAWK